MRSVYDSLELETVCVGSPIPLPSRPPPARRPHGRGNASDVSSPAVFVDWINGSDTNDGSMTSPFRTVSRAMETGVLKIVLREGTHFLSETLEVSRRWCCVSACWCDCACEKGRY